MSRAHIGLKPTCTMCWSLVWSSCAGDVLAGLLAGVLEWFGCLLGFGGGLGACWGSEMFGW
jgi:hypothetical protein